MVRPKCVYCGRPLPAPLLEAVAASAQQAIQELERQLPTEPDAAGAPPSEAPRRLLIVLDLRQARAEALQGALGLSRFEAGQRLRRGGLQLHRIAPEAEARAEASRIGAHGLATVLLDEQPLLREPVLVSGGALEPQLLRARTPEGRFDWKSDDLLLVVKGPIHRERQADGTNLRRVRSASPSPGYRFHLHRRSEPRPLELDPDAFEFDLERGRAGSSLLRLQSWIDGLQPPPAIDDAFRLLPPALGAAQEADETARALGRSTQKKSASLVLDNLRQFRFYSAWRAAVERGAASGAPRA
jgi:hypothetical protein